MTEFKDHFSSQSKSYSKFRPHYPAEIYHFLSDLAKDHDLAWDCATGTGQAARGLAPYFKKVIATDGSEAQLSQAEGPDNVEFRPAMAENSGLGAQSVDLVTVAQALHWFDLDMFYAEVKRVLKPQGILAVWSYNLLQINPMVDDILSDFNENIVGDYWPAERQLVNEGYRNIAFPFAEISPSGDNPAFKMTAMWSLNDLLGYLATWSSVVRFKAEQKKDPLKKIHTALKAAWGNEPSKLVTWPLILKIGKIQSD